MHQLEQKVCYLPQSVKKNKNIFCFVKKSKKKIKINGS